MELSVRCEDLDQEALQSLVEELSRDLSRTPGVEAEVAQSPAPPGSRGDAITLGQIAITFMTSGAAVAAIKVLKSYFEREPALRIRIQDGEREIQISGSNLDGQRFGQLVELAASAQGAGQGRKRKP